MHQTQHLVTSTLQRDMEVRHKGTALRTKLQYLVGQQIGFNAADTVTFNSLYLIQGLYQIQERLTGTFAKVTYIDTRYHNFLSAQTSNLLRLFHHRLYASVPASASCIRYGTIGTVIITAVLYLQEVTRSVATRTTGNKGSNICRLTGMMLMCHQSPFLGHHRQALSYELQDLSFLFAPKNQIHTFQGRNLIWLQLCITTSHHNQSTGMPANHFTNGLPTLCISHLSNTTGIDNANVGHFSLANSFHASHLELFTDSTCLCKVQLAT